jgi:N-acetylneuraminate synthase
LSSYTKLWQGALNETEEFALKKYVEELDMIFISTAFSRAAMDRLARMDVSAIKIGSGECNNYPLIEYVAGYGKPMIVSTGMNDIRSCEKTVSILEKNNTSYSLLHCTNIYPTPPKLVRLGAMSELQAAFPNAVIGLSDHTTSNYTCLGAVALGASILERHFTDRMDRPGPDIVCSMDPRALQDLVDGSKIIFEARGGKKEALAEEQSTIDFAFASVVAIADIKQGEKFTKSNIWVKRPGTGDFLAEDYDCLLGMTAAVDVKADEHISRSQVNGDLVS